MSYIWEPIKAAPLWVWVNLGLIGVVVLVLAVFIVWDGYTWRRKARAIRERLESRSLKEYQGRLDGRAIR